MVSAQSPRDIVRSARFKVIQEDVEHYPHLVKDETIIEPMMFAAGFVFNPSDAVRDDFQKTRRSWPPKMVLDFIGGDGVEGEMETLLDLLTE